MNTQVNPQTPSQQQFKRNIAHKLRIGQILNGRLNFEAERLQNVEIDSKKVVRTNLIANIIDKYIQDDEKKFGSITLDDATGQIKAKVFGEDIQKFENLNQGDTIMLIGLLRSWNNETYITPEIIVKKDPKFLLIRKLEVEAEQPKTIDSTKLVELKDKLIDKIKQAEESGGADIESLILELKEPPEIINREIKKLLEDGLAYEPRPGKIRYLG